MQVLYYLTCNYSEVSGMTSQKKNNKTWQNTHFKSIIDSMLICISFEVDSTHLKSIMQNL